MVRSDQELPGDLCIAAEQFDAPYMGSEIFATMSASASTIGRFHCLANISMPVTTITTPSRTTDLATNSVRFFDASL